MDDKKKKIMVIEIGTLKTVNDTRVVTWVKEWKLISHEKPWAAGIMDASLEHVPGIAEDLALHTNTELRDGTEVIFKLVNGQAMVLRAAGGLD